MSGQREILLYSQLINMGYDDELSLNAAQKCKTINEAIEWIERNQTSQTYMNGNANDIEGDEESKQTENSTAEPTINTGDVVIEWRNLKVDLETIRLEINKSNQIQMKQNQHSDHEKMDETKVEHQSLNPDLVKTFGSATKEIFSYIQMGLKEAGKGTLALNITGASLSGVTALSYGIHSVYTHYKNHQEDNKLIQKKSHNVKAELFNAKLQDLKILEEQLLKKKAALIEQERKLNSSTFQIERMNYRISKAIVCIGPTGYGKSLVCNRLIGNKKSIDNLEESKSESFNVAEYGEAKSQTKHLSKQIKTVLMDGNPQFILSVVDSPGAFDSDGQDREFENIMAEYFRACGGVNMFCIFFKFGQKNDGNYRKLLKMYGDFWGKEFWKHAVIVITNCDKDDKKLKKGLPKTKENIREFLKEINVLNEIPMYEFGENNFKPSIQKMFASLIDPNNVCCTKYKCDNIISPIDILWNEVEPMIQKQTKLIQDLNKLAEEMEELKDEMK